MAKKAPGLVVFTGSVMVLGSFLEHRQTNSKHGALVQGGEAAGDLLKQMIGITLFLIIDSFIIEEAPEFGVPFTWLVLVVYLIKQKSLIESYFTSTNGKSS